MEHLDPYYVGAVTARNKNKIKNKEVPGGDPWRFATSYPATPMGRWSTANTTFITAKNITQSGASKWRRKRNPRGWLAPKKTGGLSKVVTVILKPQAVCVWDVMP